jgi:DNA-binding XRE family transcriptional regulator
MKLSQMKPRKRVSVSASRPTKTRLLIDLQGMRESKGVTLRQVQKAIGVSNATLCQIEHGCTPRLDSALRIAAFVELPVEQIWALKGK